MTMSDKPKRLNKLQHLYNNRGSQVRKAWIRNYLNAKKGRTYEEAVREYISYKKNIVRDWADYIEKINNEVLKNWSLDDDEETEIEVKKDIKDWCSWVQTDQYAFKGDEVMQGDKHVAKGWYQGKYPSALFDEDSKTIKWLDGLKMLVWIILETKLEEVPKKLDEMITHLSKLKKGNPDKDSYLPLMYYPEIVAAYGDLKNCVSHYKQVIVTYLEKKKEKPTKQ